MIWSRLEGECIIGRTVSGPTRTDIDLVIRIENLYIKFIVFEDMNFFCW